MIIQSQAGSEVRAARKSIFARQDQAANILGMCPSTYCNRELDQENFTVRELKTLFDHLGTDGKETITAWLNSFFSA